MGDAGRIYGIFIAAIGFGVFSILILFRNGHLTSGFNKKSVMLSLGFCIPLIPHGLAGWIRHLLGYLARRRIATTGIVNKCTGHDTWKNKKDHRQRSKQHFKDGQS